MRNNRLALPLNLPLRPQLAVSLRLALAVAIFPCALSAQKNTQTAPSSYAPDLTQLLTERGSEFRPIVERYTSDRGVLNRRYRVDYSPSRQAVMTKFYATWSDKLKALDFSALSQDARADYVLLRHAIENEQTLLARDAKVWADVVALIPFADTIMALEESRREMISIDPSKSAKALDHVTQQVAIARAKIEAVTRGGSDMPANATPSRIAAYRATEVLNSLHNTLQGWYKFYEGYDPLFTWWTLTPYKSADTSITAYSRVLRERVVGWKRGDDEPIVGLPIGRDGVMADLHHEIVAYTPEELMAIAQKELDWGESEMKKASREMGFGDDWKKALEKVKETYVAPGEQVNMVKDLEFEGVEFVRKHELITLPPLAQDTWRIEMLSPEAQKVSPFFLGGEILFVSYPTDSMSDADKMMSMRGNNPHFSHATVFHEMIPGHMLQGFMNQRYYPYRQAFGTPFWSEGSAFYWETIFWDLGYQAKPEDRIGALFWRMHRAARILFSLNFHLGNWTPQQCIEFLIDKVGHERANATAEVRRSFNGSYGPLYQVAYMMGGLEFRALHHEVVDAGKMTNRQFHDFIYTHGSMPVEMVRNLMLKQPLTRDYAAQWKFGAMIPPPGGGK